MANFILGNVNQDRSRGRHERLHSVGEVINAHERHIMFFTDSIYGADFVDLSEQQRKKLKQFGHVVVRVGDVSFVDGGLRVAELQFVDDETSTAFTGILKFILGDMFEEEMLDAPKFLSMPPSSAVETGMEFRTNYLSVLEPFGNGVYILHHDYSIGANTPRFEVFPEDHKEKHTGDQVA